MTKYPFIFRFLFILVFVGSANGVFAAKKITFDQVKNTINSKLGEGELYHYSQEILSAGFQTDADWFRSMNSIEQLAAKHHLSDYPKICFFFGTSLQENLKYNRAYYYLYKTQEYLKVNPIADKELNSELHRRLGESYFWFQRYDEARNQLLQAIEYKEMPSGRYINILNTMGLIHRDQQHIDSSAYYYRKALQIAERTNNKAWIGVLSGNLGHYYLMHGETKKAIPLLEKDLQTSLETNQNGSAFQALSYLLEIDLKERKIKEAGKKMIRLEQMLVNAKNTDNYYRFYTTKTAFYEALSDYKNAWLNFRKASEFEELRRQRHDMDNVRKTEFRINFERKLAEIELLKEKRKRSSIILIGVVIIAILLSAVFFISFRSLQRRRKREKELMELRQAQFTLELEATENKMHGILSKLMEKNKVVEQLTEEVEKFQISEQIAPSKSQVKLLEKLQSITILTDDDWLEFKRVFEKLNPGFFQRIKNHLPDLTNAELRLMALIKLNLSIIEMARVLGISPDSVRKTSLRLRKKLDIEQHEDLVKFVSEN